MIENPYFLAVYILCGH